MDVVAPKRDRATEGLRKLDLVRLAVTIDVHDGPFAAFGQDAALALDRMQESHDAELRKGRRGYGYRRQMLARRNLRRRDPGDRMIGPDVDAGANLSHSEPRT